MSKAEWSGWVQAVGSIAAIYFAARIASRQIEHGRRDRAETQNERLLAVLEVVRGYARMLAVRLEVKAEILERGGSKAGILSALGPSPQFRDIEAMATAIPVHELADVRVVQVAFSLVQICRSAEEDFVSRVDKIGKLSSYMPDGYQTFGAVVAALDQLEARVEEEVRRLSNAAIRSK